MHGWADAQAAFAATLLDPTRPVPEGLTLARPEVDDATRRRRLAVYRNTVVVGLVDALAATFPAVEKLVGETFFRAAAREFVRARPPRSAVLHEYGDAFPEFLAAFPPAATAPYLADVARLERAWLRAFHAADIAPAGLDLLRDLPADGIDRVRPLPHPSASLIVSKFPVVALWAETTGRVPRSERLDLGRAETALVVRPGAEVEVRALPAAAAEFLGEILAGACLGEAADRAAAADPEFDLATHLAGLFDAGLVVDLVVPSATPE